MNIKLLIRTTKTSGEIPLRFRINDGRKFELFYKSQLKANIEDLNFILPDGSVKSGLRGGVYLERNKRLAILSQQIKEEIATIEKALGKSNNIPTNSADLEKLIEGVKNPNRYDLELNEIKSDDLVERFEYFFESSNELTLARKKGYRVTLGILKRYLIVSGIKSIKLTEVTPSFIEDFHNFVVNECKFAKSHKRIYQEFQKSGQIRKQDIPLQPRTSNTTAIKMKQLQCFFSDLLTTEELIVSPFQRLKKDARKRMMREEYSDAPIYLTADELKRVMFADVPDSLKQTQQAFILQCLLGCRISDFKQLSMENVLVSNEGIAFISYLPQKTSRHANNRVRTPLTSTAVKIIKDFGFNFKVLKNVSGQNGYNHKIKNLIELIGIDREVEVEVDRKPQMIPISQLASSKTARKTFTNLFLASQILDIYSSGLHKRGSEAVNHYVDTDNLANQLRLMNLVLGESTYKVDKELNFINE